MAWIPAPQGVTPAEAQSHFAVGGGGGISPGLARPVDTGIGASIASAIQSITQILEQRRRDQVANQLLAADNAPKATAVNPNTPAGTPDTTLSPAMAAVNARLGLPTKDSGIVPDAGGFRALVAKQLFDKQQSDSYKEALGNAEKRAHIVQMLRPPTSSLPHVMTPAEKLAAYKASPGYLKYLEDQKTYEGAASGLHAITGAAGLEVPDIAQIDTETPGAVKFVAGRNLFGGTKADPKAVTIPSLDANGNPIMDKDGKPAVTTVTAGTQLSETDAVNLMNQDPSKSGIRARGTTKNGKSFDMSLPDYYAMLNRSKSLGQRPVPPPQGETGTTAGFPHPASAQERDALAPGSTYIAPDGTIHVR